VATDVLLVSLGSTAGLRAADGALAGSLRRAGATVAEVAAARPREVRTYALTDLVWARAARAAARAGIAEHAPRAILYSTSTAALLAPRAGAIRFDALAAVNRPGRHGVWQRGLEARRLRGAPVLVPWAAASLDGAPAGRAPAVVVPVPVERSGPLGARDVDVVTYAADARKKGLDRVLAAWAQARRPGEELVVAGTDRLPPEAADAGVRASGLLAPAEFRALLRRRACSAARPGARTSASSSSRRSRTAASSSRRPRPGRTPRCRSPGSSIPRLVGDDVAGALRAALDAPRADYAARAAAAVAPFAPAAVDRVVARELLPALLGPAGVAAA
jgi:hypothetical protein